jgi:hypothetical protein
MEEVEEVMVTALAEMSTAFLVGVTAVEIHLVAKVAIACLTLVQVSKSKIGVGFPKGLLSH